MIKKLFLLGAMALVMIASFQSRATAMEAHRPPAMERPKQVKAAGLSIAFIAWVHSVGGIKQAAELLTSFVCNRNLFKAALAGCNTMECWKVWAQIKMDEYRCWSAVSEYSDLTVNFGYYSSIATIATFMAYIAARNVLNEQDSDEDE